MTFEHNPGMSSSFCHWQELTERYARQMDDLRLREPGASEALLLTGRELELCRIDVQTHGAAGLH